MIKLLKLDFLHSPAFGLAVLRIVTGFIFFMHGQQKLAGGIDKTAGFMTSLNLPAPDLMAVLVIASELVGGILLMLGLLTRGAAISLVIAMLVALFKVHFDGGFYSRDGGYEYVLALLGASLALVLTGAGAWSVDSLLDRVGASVGLGAKQTSATQRA